MISPLFLRARNNPVTFVENPQMKIISSEKQKHGNQIHQDF